jgi:hypothetical protein
VRGADGRTILTDVRFEDAADVIEDFLPIDLCSHHIFLPDRSWTAGGALRIVAY